MTESVNNRQQLQAVPYEMTLRERCLNINSCLGRREIEYLGILDLHREKLNTKKSDDEEDIQYLLQIGTDLIFIEQMMPVEIFNRRSIRQKIQEVKDELNRAFTNHRLRIRTTVGNLQPVYLGLLRCFEKLACKESMDFPQLEWLTFRLFWFLDNGTPDDIFRDRVFLDAFQRVEGIISAPFKCILNDVKNRLPQSNTQKKIQILSQKLSMIIRFPEPLNEKLKREIDKCYSVINEKRFICNFAHQQQLTLKDNIGVPENPGGACAGVHARKIYPILSIDGGGIRGIIPAKVLVKIEEITKKPISRLFSLVGGTSTGGILALGVVKKDPNHPLQPQYKASDLLNLYTDKKNAQAIFRKNLLHIPVTKEMSLIEQFQTSISNPKYLTPDLFDDRFDEDRLSTALTDVVITTNRPNEIVRKIEKIGLQGITGGLHILTSSLFDASIGTINHDDFGRGVHLITREGLSKITYRNRDFDWLYQDSVPPLTRRFSYPYNHRDAKKPIYSIKRERTHNYQMKTAAKVTSAAPTFFPVQNLSINGIPQSFVDGGVLQNNPSIPCLIYADYRGKKMSDIFMVSLGTGVEKERRTAKTNSLESLWFSTVQPSHIDDNAYTKFLTAGAGHRFQYQFSSEAPSLDGNYFYKPEELQPTIDKLIDCGNELVEDNIDHIREVCRVLDSNSI